MDSSSLSNLDISKLSDADKRDLQQQVNNEMQKAKLNEGALPLLNPPLVPLFSFLPPLVPGSPSTSLLKAPSSHFTTLTTNSNPHPHRHLLDEVHQRRPLIRETKQQGRIVCIELRGEIHGREHGGAEAFAGDARGGHVIWPLVADAGEVTYGD